MLSIVRVMDDLLRPRRRQRTVSQLTFSFRTLQSELSRQLEVTGWVRIQLLIVIRTRANSILMEEKNSGSRWSETAREFLSELSVPQGNSTQPVTLTLSGWARIQRTDGSNTFRRGVYIFITPAVRLAVAGALCVPVQTNTQWQCNLRLYFMLKKDNQYIRASPRRLHRLQTVKGWYATD